MRVPSRSSAPVAILPFLLLLPGSLGASPTSPAAAARDRSACVQAAAVELAAAAACGHKGSLEYCFRHAQPGIAAAGLERCFRHAGCSAAEAFLEADFVVRGCGAARSPAELRRRVPEATPVPTPAPIAAVEFLSGPASLVLRAGDSDFTPSIQCSTESRVATTVCPVQSTGSESGQTLPCFPTELPTQVCAAENICMKDRFGIDTCMVRRDALDTSGVVITVFLSVCFAGTLGTLVFLCCRDKVAERKLRARKEAAAIAKASAADATAASAIPPAIDEPAPAPARGPSVSQHPPRLPSPGPGAAGQNPFSDGPRY
ncbi:hypothetical protein GGS23DRAFT_594676 [Durotheca rogersii]|uniref:uncharacterized protein n=1 Tax=Durotheca rogersii TaxID=419775 RepID=UPI00221F1814|nr:uncharacterized protein GGS23DRAFT_594676 [Durotheca rogersii]KAI5865126.1 hypothetical protein GGS23DRAFT_594676 [Durotheca rogersii]